MVEDPSAQLRHSRLVLKKWNPSRPTRRLLGRRQMRDAVPSRDLSGVLLLARSRSALIDVSDARVSSRASISAGWTPDACLPTGAEALRPGILGRPRRRPVGGSPLGRRNPTAWPATNRAWHHRCMAAGGASTTWTVDDGFDLDGFLGQPLVARVATVGRTGPSVRPLWYLWEGRAFWWITGGWSRLGQLLPPPLGTDCPSGRRGCRWRVPLPGSQCGAGNGRTIAWTAHDDESSSRDRSLASGRADCRRQESPISSSMVNVITIIVRRSGATSLKPC